MPVRSSNEVLNLSLPARGKIALTVTLTLYQKKKQQQPPLYPDSASPSLIYISIRPLGFSPSPTPTPSRPRASGGVCLSKVQGRFHKVHGTTKVKVESAHIGPAPGISRAGPFSSHTTQRVHLLVGSLVQCPPEILCSTAKYGDSHAEPRPTHPSSVSTTSHSHSVSRSARGRETRPSTCKLGTMHLLGNLEPRTKET